MANFAKALAETRENLKENDWTVDDLGDWVADKIPPDELTKLKHLSRLQILSRDSDDYLIALVQLIQEWVYGVVVDAASGEVAAPATAREMDGSFGPGTYRRMKVWEYECGAPLPDSSGGTPASYIQLNGVQLEVPGVTIVHDKFSFEAAYKKRWKKAKAAGEKKKNWYFRRWSDPVREGSHTLPESVRAVATVHWDVCPSAASCFNVLRKNGVSSTFGVDTPGRDGIVIVYQWLDPALHWGYHGTIANKRSFVSFDMNNLVTIKDKYVDHDSDRSYFHRVGVDRPIIVATAHGKKRRFFGMYKEQILAVLRICKAITGYFPELEMKFPSEGGLPVEGIFDQLFDGPFRGIHTHRNFTKNKWDVCGLEDQIIYMFSKDPQLGEEFPTIAHQYQVDDLWIAQRDRDWIWGEVQERKKD